MAEAVVLGLRQVMQGGTCCDHRRFHVLHAESLQRSGLEMLQQDILWQNQE